jgi:LytR cell envelope-related transcriptional attenuator
MTVFDRLEAQLLDAHAHRHRRGLPRPAARNLVAFAAAAAAVVAILVAGLSGGSSTHGSPAAQPGDAVAPVVPGKTTVAILNATRTPGLARDAATLLERDSWRIGTVTNAPDQSLTSSCVDFTPGHSQAASIIAEQLGIHSIIPPTADVVAAAGPDADVIVVLGADRVRPSR